MDRRHAKGPLRSRILRAIREGRWRRPQIERPPERAVPSRPTREGFVASPLPIERELREIFRIDEALTIFDIGSCEGEDAIRYARLFPNARVYACEPLPENLAILNENLRRFAPEASITLLPIAVGDRDGRASFYVSSGHPDDRPRSAEWDYGNKSSSLLRPDRHREIFPWIRFDRTIEVPTERLDHVAARLQVESIDLIHLDVQGAELAVLEGAGELLARARAIWMEVEAIPLYEDQPLKPEIETFMAGHGFEIRKDTVGRISGDQLYVATPRAETRPA
jgi:FkbM family methyltransferase